MLDTISPHDGCTTLAPTHSDVFGGSSNTACRDAGNQLPAVLQSPAFLDELVTTTGHLNRHAFLCLVTDFKGGVGNILMNTCAPKRCRRVLAEG